MIGLGSDKQCREEVKKNRGEESILLPKLSLSVPSQELVKLLVGLKRKMSLIGKVDTQVSPVWPVAPRIAILIMIDLKLGGASYKQHISKRGFPLEGGTSCCFLNPTLFSERERANSTCYPQTIGMHPNCFTAVMLVHPINRSNSKHCFISL